MASHQEIPRDCGIPLDSQSTLAVVDLLSRGNRQERLVLARILYGNDAPDKDYLSAHLVGSLCQAGGHSVRNFMRGCGVGYQEIVTDALSKLKISDAGKLDVVQQEQRIVQTLFKQVTESMTDEQLAEFEQKIKEEANKHGVSYTGQLLSGGALAGVSVAGFAPFLMATTTVGALTGFLGITLPFAFYTGMTSLMGFVIGPPGWIALIGWAGYTAGNTNYKKTIPSIALISSVRSRLALEQQPVTT